MSISETWGNSLFEIRDAVNLLDGPEQSRMGEGVRMPPYARASSGRGANDPPQGSFLPAAGGHGRSARFDRAMSDVPKITSQ